MQSEIGALKDIHENANRNAANDLIRHDQMVVQQKNKKIGTTLKANINNDWQTTSAEKKIVKTVQFENQIMKNQIIMKKQNIKL